MREETGDYWTEDGLTILGPTQDLIDYCLGQIATYKVPRYVRIVSEWPMSGTKIQKFKLAATLAQELRDRGVTSAPRLRARL